MDVTPQLLREVEFREKFRGYDPDQVDELLERAGQQIAQLQGRLREALERAEQAESRAATGATYSESEETLRRTLVLAQRTADAAVAEAKEIAARTRADAEEHARKVVAQAEQQASGMLAEARAESSRLVADSMAQADAIRSGAAEEARRVIEASRQPLRDEIRALEQTRDQLKDDIEILGQHLAAERERIAGQISALEAVLADPSALRVATPPETSDAHLPPPHEYDIPEPSPRSEVDEPAGAVTAADAAGAAAAEREDVDATSWSDEALDPTDTSDDRLEQQTEAFVPVTVEDLGGTPVSWDDRSGADAEDDWTDERSEEVIVLGPDAEADYDEPTVSPYEVGGDPRPTGPQATLDLTDDRTAAERHGVRDPFFEQLRKAVDEADDDTTRAMEAFFEPDEDPRRTRFGRR